MRRWSDRSACCAAGDDHPVGAPAGRQGRRIRATENLIAAEKTAGVSHHVALSVVGADRMPDSGYMRAKVAQGTRITSSGLPYTVLRATQFFEFACGIADSCTELNTVRVPDAPIVLEEPANAVVEFVGPECLPFEQFIRAALTQYRDSPNVVTDPHARYFGTALEPRSLAAADAAVGGRLRFATWLPGR